MSQEEQGKFDAESFITRSMLSFINKHIPSSHLSSLDEIILSYVVTVLESLATDFLKFEECFDVEEFSEMLGAYFPGFDTISHSTVSEWIFELVTSLKNESQKNKPKNESEAFESFLTEIEAEEEKRSKRNSESSSSDSSIYSYATNCKPNTSRTYRMSETSDDEVSSIVQKFHKCARVEPDDENLKVLLEMFPNLDSVEGGNFLLLSNGDIEKAVQLILSQENDEEEEGFKNSKKMLAPHVKGKGVVEEKVLKERIVARYGFIDQAEDSKEFRPPPLKTEPKKLVRYRESQVVSTKGERFSEVRCGPDGGEIKNYIYKPPKPY